MTDPRITPNRTKARKRALDILYEADLRGLDPAQTLADRIAIGEPPVRPFTIAIVEGVRANRAEVDALISGALRTGWSIERMPRVDRTLARIATYELLQGDTEPQVAVSEAVTLGQQLSTEESPAFLNGVLGTILARVTARGPLVDAAEPDAAEPDDAAPTATPDAADAAAHDRAADAAE